VVFLFFGKRLRDPAIPHARPRNGSQRITPFPA
jgi:hypothetical protein